MEPLVVDLGFSVFPTIHTREGGNVSPQIEIKGLLAASVAIIAVNPFIKNCCSFCPWVIWNIEPRSPIPAGIPRMPIVASPVPAVQGTNGYGEIGYTGPCPPSGETHRYFFKVYGLDAMLDCPGGANDHDLVRAMRGHVLQFGETFAMYASGIDAGMR
jgi:Raf kinase inhibitor-like YbhB/YbcL family protein